MTSKLGDTLYTYDENPTLDAATLRAAADANNGTVKLKAKWTPYIENENGTKFIATASFYIQKGVEVHGTDYDYTITRVTEFTDTTFSSRVLGQPALTTNNTQTIFNPPTDALTANQVDRDIRDTIIKPFYGIELVDGMPSDEEVFTYLRESNKTNDVLVLNGHNLPKEKLTPDRFAVRWYVVKYDQTDGFHVDGVIVAKPASLVVTKTFSGDSEAISTVKNNFFITIEHDETTYNPNGNISADNHLVDFKLRLDPDSTPVKDATTGTISMGYTSYNTETDTYTWVVTGYQGVNYQVIENDYTAGGNIQCEPSYRIINRRDEPTSTGWATYAPPEAADGHRKGVEVRIHAYDDDLPLASRQTVILRNSYTKPGVFSFFKRDSSSDGGGIPGVSFALLKKDGTAIQLYKNPDNPFHYSTEAIEPYTEAVSSVVTDDLGHFYVELRSGEYKLVETVPRGYSGASEVCFAVEQSEDGYAFKPDSISAVSTNPNQVWATISETNSNQLSIINLPYTFDITVNNTWLQPQSGTFNCDDKPVVVELLRNGVKCNSATLTKDNSWSAKWENMPLFVDGKLASYSIRVAKIGNVYHSSDLHGSTDGYADYNVSEDEYKYSLNGGATHPEAYWPDENNKDAVIFADHLLIGVNIQPVNGELTFKKHADTITGSALPGAEYKLYNDEGMQSLYGTAVSDAAGMVNFGALAAGNYYLVESKAPSGFIKDETVYKVAVLGGVAKMTKYKVSSAENADKYTGEQSKLQVSDVANETSIPITFKYRSTYDEPLTGGKIQLYSLSEDGSVETPIEELTIDDENGIIRTPNFTNGTYRLKQTKAYENGNIKYNLYLNSYDFKVDNGTAYPVIQLHLFRLLRQIFHAPGFDITDNATTGYVITLYNDLPVVAPSPSTSTSPNPSSSPNPTENPNPSDNPSPSASPNPTVSPNPTTQPVIRWDIPYGGLPQTGQMNWPVPVLIGLGVVLIAAGIVVARKKGKK